MVDYKHSDVTEKIIQAAYEVYNALGYGFLEKVYENALIRELGLLDLHGVQQKSVKVYYKGDIVGNYTADLVVDEKVIVEVKAINRLDKAHEVQLVNYLKATNIEVGLLINFGPQIKIIRRIFSR